MHNTLSMTLRSLSSLSSLRCVRPRDASVHAGQAVAVPQVEETLGNKRLQRNARSPLHRPVTVFGILHHVAELLQQIHGSPRGLSGGSVAPAKLAPAWAEAPWPVEWTK